MGKYGSMSAINQLGAEKTRQFSAGIKPNFTVEDLKKDFAELEEKLAEKFISVINEQIEKKSINFELLNALLKANGRITKTTLKAGIDKKGKRVFVKQGSTFFKVSFRELWWLIESGRKDLGVLPNSILTSEYKKFKRIYKDSIKHLLTKNNHA